MRQPSAISVCLVRDLCRSLFLNEYRLEAEQAGAPLTQQGALMQLLKDKGIVPDDQLAPYLDQAAIPAVFARATRLRLERVFSTAADKEEQAAKQREE